MPRNIIFALLIRGFTTLAVQTLLIREFFISFYGNELTIGIVLGNWIILEALGSHLFGHFTHRIKHPLFTYILLQLIMILYLPVSIYLVRDVKNILGLSSGEGANFLAIILSSLGILAPLGLLDGAQFPLGCRLLPAEANKESGVPGRVYLLEAAGFVVAGPVFTYIMLTRLNSFSITFVLGALNLSSAMFLAQGHPEDRSKRPLFFVLAALFTLFVLGSFYPAQRLQEVSCARQWPGQKLLAYRNSVYANLAATRSEKQYTFYHNGLPIITTPIPDISHTEDLAHLTMLNIPQPKNVLLLNAGAGGLIREILKYPVEKVTYAELDPALIKLIKDFPTDLTREELGDPRLDIRYIDGRRFLDLKNEKFDCVILNLSLPSTLQINRFFTREFFSAVKGALSEDGVFSLSLPCSLSYINPQLGRLNMSIFNTLSEVFYVQVIPGDYNIYLNSRKQLSFGPEALIERMQEERIPTRLFTANYLKYRLNSKWQDWFKDSTAPYKDARNNSDLNPSGVFYGIAYWNSIFSANLQRVFDLLDRVTLIFCALAAVLLGLIFFLMKKNVFGFAIATTGALGLGMSLILIYSYQTLYGYVFSRFALLSASFMLGLVIGSWQMTRRINDTLGSVGSFMKIEVLLCAYPLVLIPLLSYLRNFTSQNLAIVFFVGSAILGYLTGLEFPLANKIYLRDKKQGRGAGMLYALDLGGSWIAAISVSVVLVPVIGIPQTCLFFAILKIVSLGLLFLQGRF